MSAAAMRAPTRITLPGGGQRRIERDGYLRPHLIEGLDPAANPVQQDAYTHDKADNILSRHTLRGPYAYGYDPLDRLTDVDGATEQNAFVYDPVGNRLSEQAYTDASGVPHDWEYDESDRLTRRGPISYEYDANGNLIRETNADTGSERRYRYNVDNRLIDVRNHADTLIAGYAYDPFGRRVQKTVGATTTYYLYAEEGMVAELDATGSVTTGYGWKPHGIWGTDPLFIRQGGVVGYYHNDHLGTPQAVTSASGVLLWSTRYDAFGKATIESAQITNNLRFPGQYFDVETGLHYNYHRYYDPSAGRYTTVDPIGLEGGVNAYVYVAGNALSRLDPFRLRQMSCPPGTVAPGVACTIDDGSGNARRKPQCALGSPDCLLLDGTSSENIDRKPLRDYDRYGNSMCYSTCMQDEKGAEKQLCRLAKPYPVAKYACKAAEVYSRHTACEERCFPTEDYGCWERY